MHTSDTVRDSDGLYFAQVCILLHAGGFSRGAGKLRRCVGVSGCTPPLLLPCAAPGRSHHRGALSHTARRAGEPGRRSRRKPRVLNTYRRKKPRTPWWRLAMPGKCAHSLLGQTFNRRWIAQILTVNLSSSTLPSSSRWSFQPVVKLNLNPQPIIFLYIWRDGRYKRVSSC